jgi:diaminopimelate epimerase
MFNPDGTEDFCGNGLRCAAWHVHLEQGATDFTIKHLDREVPVSIQNNKIFTIIGRADYTPSAVPHTGFRELFNGNIWSGMDAGMPLSLYGSALTTGSTHVVIPTFAIPDDDSFRSVSAKIEVDPLFPNRTSVIWRREIEPMRLEIRIWERGVGETQGCGTGSSAAAADYLRSKGIGGRVEVLNPGGAVIVFMSRWDSPITVEGTAERVYTGEFRLG